MITRWRSLMRPDDAHHPASPRLSEAFSGWILGTLWAFGCLWLGGLGTWALVPGLLLGGLMALWGWRHLEWLFWLPPVVVVAMLLQPLSPLPLHGRSGPVLYVDMLMAGVAAVAVARAVAFRRRLLPRTPLDRLLAAILVVGVLNLVGGPRHGQSLQMLKECAVAIAVYYATVTVASRPGGARWVWPAFPLAAGLVGLHALWAASLGPGRLDEQARAADGAWGAPYGLFNAMLCALPVTVGLALNAGRRWARRAWVVAALAGAAGIATHVAARAVFLQPRGWERLADPLQFSALALAWVALVMLGGMAWRFGRRHAQERPRWVALAIAFSLMPVMQLGTDVLSSPTAQLLLAIGGGLTVGAWRSARAAVEPAEEAADAAVAETLRKAA